MRNILGILFLFFFLHLPAQVDTVLTLPAIDVSDTPVDISTCILVPKIDTRKDFSFSQDIAEILSQHSALSIKIYSPGSLATLSVHGGSPSHTEILWNGLDLRSPLNGGMDLSLLQGGLFDGIAVSESGAIGGRMELITDDTPHPGWHGKAGFSAKDYHLYHGYGQLSFANKKWSSDNRISTGFGQNDYAFLVNGKKRRQENSALKQWSIAQNNTFHLTDIQTIKSFLLYNQSHRNIPPAKSVTPRHEQQDDTALRAGLEWKRQGKTTTASLKTAFLEESLIFQSDLFPAVKSSARSWVTKAAVTARPNDREHYDFSGDYIHTSGHHPSFHGEKQRNDVTLSATYHRHFFDKKLHTATGISLTVIDNDALPLGYSFLARYRFNERHLLELAAEKNTNAPTFNDLYWEDAFAKGNPSLKTEAGNKLTFRHQFQYHSPTFGFSSGIHIYSNRVDNRIIWLPVNGVWQPRNIRTVWSRGGDISVRLTKIINALQIKNTILYNYTVATITRRYADDVLSHIGAQLFYVPVHTFHESLTLQYHRFSLSYHQNIFGKRFTTSDNLTSEALPAYTVANIKIGYEWQLQKLNLKAHLGVTNIWNADYEVIKGWSMPLRGWDLGIVCGF